MRAINIEIAQVKGFRVREVYLTHKVNEHSVLKIVGAVNQEASEDILKLCMRDVQLNVNVREESRITTLFIGNVYNVEIQHKGYEDILHLELISGTINLDLKEKTRTFQDKSTEIFALMEYVNKEESAKFHTTKQSKQIKDVVAQYKETDWEFLKRMASLMNEPLLPDVTSSGVQYQIGLENNSVTQEIDILEYAIQNELSSMRLKNNRGITLSEAESNQYKVKSRDLLFLGDKVTLEQETFYVHEIQGCLDGEELVFTYICRHKKHFKVPYTPNIKMIGASLEGTVKDVSGTMLEIDLDVDRQNTMCGSKKFPYATVYSSEGGTGWYCMPEEGDKIRLYFPSEREKDAYVISSVHLEVNNVDPSSSYVTGSPILSQMPAARSDPSFKSIQNKQKKEIIFSSKSIMITNNKDMVFMMDDDDGIVIDTKGLVHIHSDEKIEIESMNSILMTAKEELVLEHGVNSDHYFKMSQGNITMKGNEFRLQEKE